RGLTVAPDVQRRDQMGNLDDRRAIEESIDEGEAKELSFRARGNRAQEATWVRQVVAVDRVPEVFGFWGSAHFADVLRRLDGGPDGFCKALDLRGVEMSSARGAAAPSRGPGARALAARPRV